MPRTAHLIVQTLTWKWQKRLGIDGRPKPTVYRGVNLDVPDSLPELQEAVGFLLCQPDRRERILEILDALDADEAEELAAFKRQYGEDPQWAPAVPTVPLRSVNLSRVFDFLDRNGGTDQPSTEAAVEERPFDNATLPGKAPDDTQVVSQSTVELRVDGVIFDHSGTGSNDLPDESDGVRRQDDV